MLTESERNFSAIYPIFTAKIPDGMSSNAPALFNPDSTNFRRFTFLKGFFVFLFLVNSHIGLGQGVTITSPQSPGPTSENPIDVFVKFKNAVNISISDKLNLTNGTIISESRLTPDFENFEHYDLPTRNIKASINDFLNNFFVPPFLGGGSFQSQLQSYLTIKFKNLIVAFDVNSKGEVFYLTFANGVFKFNDGSDDEPIIPPEEFESPIDILIDNEDRILIADSDAYTVKVFNSPNYGFAYSIGGAQGADKNEFYGPTGLAVDSQNRIYIADTYPGEYSGNDPRKKVRDKIKIYTITDSDYDYVDFFGKDQLNDPFRLTVDSNNNAYVSDSGGNNGRIRIFDSAGILRNTIANDNSHSPSSLSVDSFGYLYVLDYNGDITFNGIYQNPLDLLIKFEELKNKVYSVDVYKPLDINFNTEIINSFDKNLTLPVDIALNQCENILVLDLDFSGKIDDANFHFDIEAFRRNDIFQLAVSPINEGFVGIELKDFNFFKCDPQPFGDFSIEYKLESNNTAPVARDDSYEVNQDETLTIVAPGVLGNDTDVNSDGLTAIIQTQPSNGRVTLNSDGSFTYIPNPGYFGNDSFTYVANDGTVNSNIATVTITINKVVPPNTAPVARDDSYEVNQDETLPVGAPGVLGNDTDVNSDGLTAISQSQPSNGTVILNSDGSFNYIPNPGYFGTDSFTYVANDGTVNSNIATVTITINKVVPPDTAPVARDDSYEVNQDETLTIVAPGVLGNDTDVNSDGLTAIIQSQPSNGTVTLNSDGSFTYIPNPGYFGTDSFTYVANDGTVNSNIATVTITINKVVPPNTAPVARDDSYEVNQDETLTIVAPGVLGNDTDVNSDGLTAIIQTQPSNGRVTLNSDGSFTYIPNPGYFGNDSFTYVANDGTVNSNIATVTITINKVAPPNTAPVTRDDSYEVNQDETLPVGAPGVLGNDMDVNSDGLTAIIQTQPSNGRVTLNSDGSFTYIPNPGYFGTDSFTYVANDGTVDSNIATTNITVNLRLTINCPSDITENLDGNCQFLLGDYTSLATTNISASITQNPAAGTIINSNTKVTLTATASENTSDCSFNVLVQDVTDPVAKCNSAISIFLDENNQASITVNDIDNGSSDSCGNIQMAIDKSNFTENDLGENPVVLTVTDASGNMASCTTIVTVKPFDPEPNFECISQMQVFLDENGVAKIIPSDLITGNPGNTTFSLDKNTFTCDDLPGSTVNLSYSGSVTGQCSVDILVIDSIAPQENCVSIYDLYLSANGTATLTTEEINNNSTDNCSITRMELSRTNFDEGDLGENTVLFTVYDSSGNSSMCEVLVNVIQGNTSGEITCKEEFTLQLDENGNSILDPNDLVLGDISAYTITASRTNFTCSDLGEQIITVSYNNGTDSGSCDVTILVQDEIAPTVLTNSITINLNDNNQAVINTTLIDAGSTDNCGITSFSLDKLIFGCKDIGENTVTLTATDASGNNTSQTAIINVTGECDDVIEVPDNDIDHIFIYPNPTSGFFQIAVPSNKKLMEIQVFDMRGRYIMNKKFANDNFDYRMTVSGVQQGVYTLKMITDKGDVIRRLIIF